MRVEGSSRTARFALALALATLSGTIACERRTSRTPSDLREEYLAAWHANDPDRAYALLSPTVRADVPLEGFRERWTIDREALDTTDVATPPPADETAIVYEGLTVHDQGIVLHWTKVGSEYRVVDGLPVVP